MEHQVATDLGSIYICASAAFKDVLSSSGYRCSCALFGKSQGSANSGTHRAQRYARTVRRSVVNRSAVQREASPYPRAAQIHATINLGTVEQDLIAKLRADRCESPGSTVRSSVAEHRLLAPKAAANGGTREAHLAIRRELLPHEYGGSNVDVIGLQRPPASIVISSAECCTIKQQPRSDLGCQQPNRSLGDKAAIQGYHVANPRGLCVQREALPGRDCCSACPDVSPDTRGTETHTAVSNKLLQ